jgi:hypothetical protein
LNSLWCWIFVFVNFCEQKISSRLFENRLLNRSPPRAEVPCKISVRRKRFGGDKKASKMHSSCTEKAMLSLLGRVANMHHLDSGIFATAGAQRNAIRRQNLLYFVQRN